MCVGSYSIHFAQRAMDKRCKHSLFRAKIYVIYLLFSSIYAEETGVCKINIHKKQLIRDGRLRVKPSSWIEKPRGVSPNRKCVLDSEQQ